MRIATTYTLALLGLLTIGYYPALGQEMERSAVAAAGDQYTKPEYSLHFTIGEMAVGDVGPGSTILLGFHQAWAVITSTEEETAPLFSINIFPNPTVGEITIENGESLDVHISDAQGRPLQHRTIQAGQSQFDMSALPAGMYLMTVARPGHDAVRSYRIAKLE